MSARHCRNCRASAAADAIFPTAFHRNALQLLATLCLTGTLHASDSIPAPAQTKPIAIKGATIHPVSGPDIPAGTIVFESGKISALGPDAAIPAGAEVIEANGKHIYPGLINA
ncbi:MAG: hypothetical protein WAO00_09440, partial [Chthoniobacterales bacterium]